MNRLYRRMKWSFVLAILLHTSLSFAEVAPSQASVIPVIGEVRYTLIDLGESDVDPAALKRTFLMPSLAPVINNNGQIIGNRREGGFVRDPQQGEWMPYIHDVTINFHALTHRGDLLVSLNRSMNPPEWMIWPTLGGQNGPRQRLDTESFPKGTPVFWGLTNDRMAIGNLILSKDQSQPIYWRSEEHLHYLADRQGKVINGKAQGINGRGQIVGLFENAEETPPSVWSPEFGLMAMRNFRSKPVPNGTAELIDTVIAEDGTVYGTYRLKYDDQSKPPVIYTYAWMPYEGGGFKLLDLDGMQISALNDWHSLVGSINGQAALCEPGRKPIALSKYMKPDLLEGWELLEATSINNWGDIVGYGRLNGNMHLFLARALNNRAPYLNQ